jgi:hypothetical protein
MQAVDRIDFSNNWITVTYLFALILLVLLKLINQEKLLGYTRAFFLKGFVIKRAEERESFFTVFNIAIYVFSLIIYGLLLLSVYLYLVPDSYASFNLFSWLILIVATYFSAQLLLTFLISRVFSIQNEILHFISAKVGYFYNTALLLFPFLIINTYSFFSIYLLFGVFVVLFLLSTVLVLTNNKNLIINKLFYFILYLCALEIAPLLIIYKITV